MTAIAIAHALLRPYEAETDRRFIRKSFVESYHDGALRRVPHRFARDPLRAEVDALLASSCTWVAFDQVDREKLVGWAAARPTELGACLRYVYVVHLRRTHGLGRALARRVLESCGWREGEPWLYDHVTQRGAKIVRAYERATHHPWACTPAAASEGARA